MVTRMVRRQLVTAAVLLTLLLGLACIKKTSGVVTPWEKVTTYNSLLASTNNTITKGVILANSDNLLTKEYTAPVLVMSSKVAVTDDELTNLLAKGAALTPADTLRVNELLVQVRDSANKLINGGTLNIKNPQSQTTISADVQSLVDLVQLIINMIPQLIANPVPPVKGVIK